MKNQNSARILKSPVNDPKEKILEASLRVFLRLGYGGATLSTIAKEAGMSKQLVLYHLKSPEDALVSLAHRWGETGRMVTIETLAETYGSAEDRILAIVVATFKWMKQYKALSSLTPVLFQSTPLLGPLKSLQTSTLETGFVRIVGFLRNVKGFENMREEGLLEVARVIHSSIMGCSLYVIGLDQWNLIDRSE